MEPENMELTDISGFPEVIEKPEDAYIIVRQLPVIEETLAALSSQVQARVNEALALECTEDTVKAVKAVRAALNKEYSAMEDKRKAVKNAVMNPYDAFEKAYKQHIGDLYKDADYKLGSKIKGTEDGLKDIKRDELRRYYIEYCACAQIDFVSFERWNPNVTLSATSKALKKEAEQFINKIADDVAIINQRTDDCDEVMVEYRKSLELRGAIEAVTNRRKAVEEQKQRAADKAAQDAAFAAAMEKVNAAATQQTPPPLAPPVEVPAPAPQPVTPSPVLNDDTIMTLSFTVTHKRSELRRLKQFLIDGGYTIE
jgi:DNA repair exonuclease SbcCD ATPase subunit